MVDGMSRIQLFYKDLSEIVGSNGFSVVRLTDADEKRAVCIICDKAMSEQMAIRFNRTPGHEQMLPEVLLRLMGDRTVKNLELFIYDIEDGQYQVILVDNRSYSPIPIRISDAVLMHNIAKIPLYIDQNLMIRQSTPYDAETTGISIPINTLDTDRLNRELERAVADENYRLASYLHEEIKRRQKN